MSLVVPTRVGIKKDARSFFADVHFFRFKHFDQIRDTHEFGLDHIRDFSEYGQMERYLSQDILKLALERQKMAFISGPRQVGKTFLAKELASSFTKTAYKNWDEAEFRRLWTKSPNSIKDSFTLESTKERRLLILDEIHKSKGWKQKVKGLYDELNQEISIIVTGSARLGIFKKGGDSLMGRYLNFRLHPFSVGELSKKPSVSPQKWMETLFEKSSRSGSQESLDQLLRWSGFPEPLIAKSDQVHRLWQRGRTEKIVREDLRDLSRLPELSQVEMLTSLLPTKVGSPLSIQSLREDLEVAHDTVSRWLRYLQELFYFYEVKPWTKSIPRTLKKEGKIYLYDWTEVEDEGIRFENLTAGHLLKACDYWTDTGIGNFNLHYLRNKEKQEIDFLIVKDRKPWLMVEAKKSDVKINHKLVDRFQGYTKCPYVQVVSTPDIWLRDREKLVISANRFFAGLP